MTRLQRNVSNAAVLLPFLVVAAVVPLLCHACRRTMPAARVRARAATRVGERDLDRVIGLADVDLDAALVRVLERVRQPLLHNRVEREVGARPLPR
jgi:hypothetical protein